MPVNLHRFSIIGLHGKYDINIPIKDNRLILIGVNGLGKTTVINILYLALSGQWGRLIDYDFLAIELVLNGDEIVFTREDILAKSRAQRNFQRILSIHSNRTPYPRPMVSRVLSHPMVREARDQEVLFDDSVLKKISVDVDIGYNIVRRIIADFPKELQRDLLDGLEEPESFSRMTAILEGAEVRQVIYLPTYRRIEQDLKAIFPNITEEELRKLTTTSRAVSKPGARGFVELVHFGMEDVEERLASELETIQRRTREQLTGLTASYLQDIIRSRADVVEPALIRIMSDAVVEAVLSRVDENTLSSEDKREVQEAIRRIRSGGSSPLARDQYLTYFFSRLMDIYTDLNMSESAIRQLADTCNKYFVGKRVRYDDANFTAKVFDRQGKPLSWKSLSSGEKQVASLFTHLYLSPEESQIVLIDEPELSLSVRWQKLLLPDILASGRCKLLIAVTHSPFIYKNDLASYAVDLSRLTTFRPNN